MNTPTGFIGAGSRALSGHYPVVTNLAGADLKAVSELDGRRLETVLTQYSIPSSYVDHRRMLADVEIDAVYVVMGETFVKDVALECMEAGKHVFIEKPPGANIEESLELLTSATKNQVICMVGLQRRYSAVTAEARRLTKANGPVTLALGEFHKPEPSIDPMGNSTLWSDICHIVDWVAYVVDSPVSEVTAYQNAFEYKTRDCYNALIKFDNEAVGIITANRTSGGRYMRSEVHARGIGCYLRIPEEIEIVERGQESRTIRGLDLVDRKGSDYSDVIEKHSYSGERSMHEHFIECIQTDTFPISDIRNVIDSFRLVDRIEGNN